MIRSRKSAVFLLLATAAIGCTESNPTTPSANSGKTAGLDPNTQMVVLTCEASRKQLTVTCAAPQLGGNKGKVAADIVYGGQNTFVTLTSTNVAYNSGTGRFFLRCIK